ncbi:hypothetical protein [Ktedonobacter sp. SOSP1-52]|uniref:hypothetical protein n=1 Tax=Ktedonobacter sp. SOSP1-52 TaxID=2778366 RepID=UPI0019152E9A|nr:hypothetical protein [Ktedonobacter sp. SOSP1-52]
MGVQVAHLASNIANAKAIHQTQHSSIELSKQTGNGSRTGLTAIFTQAERVFGYRQATITTWLTRAGGHAQTLHEHFFFHLHLPHLPLDELRTRLRCSTQVLWLAIDLLGH